MKLNNNIPVINALRGIAALMVTMFHFTKDFCSEESFMRNIFRIGWSGVEVFFVISGFVITWSMIGNNYQLRNFKSFILKRFIRIEPPYVISIVVVISLNLLSTLAPGFKGAAFNIDFTNILLHLGYMVRYFEQTWLNPVYWSLEIEFHFYLLIALILPLLIYKKYQIYLVAIALLWSFILLPHEISPLFSYIDIFLLGIVLALFKSKTLNTVSFYVIFILLLTSVFLNHTLLIFIVSTIAALLIGYFDWLLDHPALAFMGKISYSLYLLHVPIGGRVINLSRRLDLNETEKIIVIVLALAVSISASYLFFKLIEKPFHRMARKIQLQ